MSGEIKRRAEQLAGEGKTPLFFAKDRKLLSIIAVADAMKEESPRAIAELKNMGIPMVMVTGDHERTARATFRNIHENLFWAFIYNVIGIPLAAGIWIPIFGWQLNPMFGAAAMSLSSFCVVTNALRLNLFKMHKNNSKKTETKMEKTMKIEGMMCGHCEASVKKGLEALEQVASAEVSYEKGTAVVTLKEAVSDDVLKKAVEDLDYKVTGIL